MKTITPAQHAAIVARAYMKNPRSAMFTRMGESQESACKRIVSASKRAGKAACGRDFPIYKAGMSTKEYVRAYENVNSGKGLKTGFYELADLNCKPAALYEGGLIDYAPTVEECEPMPIEAAAAAVCADVAPAAPAAAVPTADVVRPAAPEAAEPVPLDWQTLAARPTAIYATPVRKIGVHEWRTVVYAHGTYGACTDHVWRRVDQNRGAFKMARDWPTYDSDRTHSGLPLTLGKLYAEHEEAIEAALNSLRLAAPATAADPAPRLPPAACQAAPCTAADPAPASPSEPAAPVQMPTEAVSTSLDHDAFAHRTSPRGDIHHSAPAQSSCDWPSAAQEAKLQFPRRPYRGPSDRHLTAVFLQYRFKSARRACQFSAPAFLDGRHGHGRAALSPCDRYVRKGESPRGICPSVPGSNDHECQRIGPFAGFLERIVSSLPGSDVLIMHPAGITRNSQAAVSPVMRRAHGPPISRASTNPESEQHL